MHGCGLVPSVCFPKSPVIVELEAKHTHARSLSYMQPEVQVNAANWNVSALQQPEGNENEENEEAADDEVWKQFQTMDEQKRKQVRTHVFNTEAWGIQSIRTTARPENVSHTCFSVPSCCGASCTPQHISEVGRPHPP
eukprot:1124627-Pelagomonas_calceolata.AAC.2